MNEYRILEKMEIESSPQLTKHNTQKNKPTAWSKGLCGTVQIKYSKKNV